MIIKDKFHCFSKKGGINFTMLKKKSSGDLVYLFMIFFLILSISILYVKVKFPSQTAGLGPYTESSYNQG